MLRGQNLLHTNFIPCKVHPPTFPGLVQHNTAVHPTLLPRIHLRELRAYAPTGTRNHSSKLSVYLLKTPISSEAAGLAWRGGCWPSVPPHLPPHGLHQQLRVVFQQGMQIWAGQGAQWSRGGGARAALGLGLGHVSPNQPVIGL